LQIQQRVGEAEILLRGEAVASGPYELKLERAPLSLGGTPHLTAKGYVRLETLQSLLWAARGRRIQIRLDRAIELDVEITLFIRAARYLAFACQDAAALLSAAAPDQEPLPPIGNVRSTGGDPEPAPPPAVALTSPPDSPEPPAVVLAAPRVPSE